MIKSHQISQFPSGVIVNLNNTDERLLYFKKAMTTTAFFSFMGNIVVRRNRWVSVHIDENQFFGSMWAHVARIFSMISQGLNLILINRPLLFKRGGNDSFLNNGIVARYSLAINGYRELANEYFGKDSIEAYHIRRVIRNEILLASLLIAKLECLQDKNGNNLDQLNKLVIAQYEDKDIKSALCKLIYFSTPITVLRFLERTKIIRSIIRNKMCRPYGSASTA